MILRTKTLQCRALPLALVRRTNWSDTLWAAENYVNSTSEPDRVLISPERLNRLLDQIAATA
jgi:hypothetical protein